MKDAICIIPARGGSVRIPGKNILPFPAGGIPMIHHALDCAAVSELFDDIFVSTDDARVVEVVEKWGDARILKRPEHLAHGSVGTQDVMRQALDYLAADGIDPEYACCLYPCAPLLDPEDLIEARKLLEKTGCAFVYSIVQANPPIQRALRHRLEGDGTLEPVWRQFECVQSQDLEPRWHDAGQFYFGRTDAFRKNTRLYGPESAGMPLPRYRAIDIDTPEDLRLAELVYKGLEAEDGEAK